MIIISYESFHQLNLMKVYGFSELELSKGALLCAACDFQLVENYAVFSASMPSMGVHDVGKNFRVESVILTFQGLIRTNRSSDHWRSIEKLAIDCLLVEPRRTVKN